MAGARTKATNFTGRQREELIAQHSEELAQRQKELSIANQVEAETRENEVVDYAAGPVPKTIPVDDTPEIVDGVVDEGVALSEQDYVVIRVNEDIEDMTFGVGNNYTFEVGRKYRVPRDLARHLEEKGRLWH